MKRIMLVGLLLAGSMLGGFACGGSSSSSTEVISLSDAWALYPMAQQWAKSYQAAHPGVRIDISGGGAGKGMTDALTGTVDIGMVSRGIKPEEKQQGALGFAVVKDAVVATLSAANPQLAAIRARGVTRAQLAAIFLSGNGTWEELAGQPAGATPVHLFARADACGAAQTWAAYLDTKAQQEQLKGTGVSGDPGMAEAVGKDPLALGYNNIGYAYDPATRQPYPTLAIVPLDQNGNGTLDPDEQVYDTQEKLVAAINAGKYPSPPARDLYFVTKGVPTRPAVVAFLRWVMTDGQNEIAPAGFVRLPAATVAAALAQLGQ